MRDSFEMFFLPSDGQHNKVVFADLLAASGVQAVATHILNARPEPSSSSCWTEEEQSTWVLKAQGLLAYRRQHPFAKISKDKQLSEVLTETSAVAQGLAKLSEAGLRSSTLCCQHACHLVCQGSDGRSWSELSIEQRASRDAML